MSVRGILRMGDPRLRMKASAVDLFGDDKLANLISGDVPHESQGESA